MNPHSMRVLEFAKIQSALVDRTTFAGGAMLAASLRPFSDRAALLERLCEVSEIRRILDESDLPIHGLADLPRILDRAEPEGSVLPAVDLAPVARSLHVVHRLRSFFQEWEEKIPRLAARAHELSALGVLREEIDRCIDSAGEIRDSASPALRKIRRDQESLREKLNDRLAQVARQLSSPDAEAMVTLRGHRYVVVVRRDRTKGLTGIIHGQSGSGASIILEPAPVVPLNNEMAELRSAEEEEIQRILTELTAQVRGHVPELRRNEEILAHLDLVSAAGKLSRDLDCVPALPSEKGEIVVRGGRHPLLEMRNGARKTVPLDLVLGGESARTLVITGPNTGGKTVALKTVGLFALMHQSGLHLPAAEGTRFPIFEDIFADIGDEQSIEASLSTFSSHLSHVVQMLEGAGPQTLVLLDELGVGTDPDEGAALGKVVLRELTRRGALTIVTTHYGSLKVFAHETEGLQNASLEFDRESLTPTYRFLPGIPGSSEAISIARRLGFPQQLLDEARAMLGVEREDVEGLLADLRAKRSELETASQDLARERAQLEETQSKVEKRLAGIQEEKVRAKREALEEARRLIERSKAELNEILDAVRHDDGGKAWGRARSRIGEMGRNVERELIVEERSREAAHPANPAEIRQGTLVAIPLLGWKGNALGPPGSNGKVLVAVGSFRLELPVTSLEIRTPSPGERRAAAPSHAMADDSASSAAKFEIDLRGRTVEEALDEVDRTLDGLVVRGGNWLRIIHGKGTGALRNAITERLKGDQRVKTFRMGEPAEGGGGVTIAVLH
ncbi:MAG TPA: endonuclease MutS2 [bacterium]|nr:endonuclease MutS2 [bacterium]